MILRTPKHNFKILTVGNFPGGPVVKNLPLNIEDMGLIPGLGTKIPHATGQLSLCAAITEPTQATTETQCSQMKNKS